MTDSANLLHNLIRHMPGAIFVGRLSPDGHISLPYMSHAYAELFDVIPEEVSSDATPVFQRFHPDDLDAFITLLHYSARTLTPWEYEARITLPSRGLQWRHGKATTHLQANGDILWFGITTDVTSRKEAELALRESEERFQTMFRRHSAVMLLITPQSGAIVDANQAAEQMYGYTLDQLTSMNISDINTLDPVQVVQNCAEASQEKQNHFIFTHKIASGELRTVEVYSTPIIDNQKSLLFSIIHDITERAKAEQELHQIHSEMEQMVLDRTISLQKTNTRLLEEIEAGRKKQRTLLDYQQRLESLSLELALSEERERNRIAGELHDQVSQNLIVAKMRLSALISQNGGTDTDAEINRIEEIVDLALKDIRSLTFQLRPPVLANAGLESALEWLCEEFSREFTTQFSIQDDGQPKVLIYEVRSVVFQVVRELMMNVVKHARATRTSVALERVDDHLYITVRDDGIGIGPDYNEGFGLFNTRQKIEGLGGYFGIASLPEMGTGVTLSVPLPLQQDERIIES